MALSEPKCSAEQQGARGGREEQHATRPETAALLRSDKLVSHLHDTYLFPTCILYTGFRTAFRGKFFALYSTVTKLQAFLGIEYLDQISHV